VTSEERLNKPFLGVHANREEQMEGYKACPLNLNEEDFGLDIFWVDGMDCEKIVLPAVVLTAMGLFDESRPNFDSYEEDSAAAAELLEMRLGICGFHVEPGFDLYKQVMYLCAPGPPLKRQPFVRIAKSPTENMILCRTHEAGACFEGCPDVIVR
jgi:hypothetical protein